ncbi:MAG: class II glutamine amidotransferase [Candidatus Njordarchaeia archaeon]
MCRLVGVFSSEYGALSSPIWNGFKKIAQRDGTFGYAHSDGWGAAWIADDLILSYRSVKPIWECNQPNLIRGSDIILHARKATAGPVSLPNTHPFVMDDIVLVHNGDIVLKTEPWNHRPIGQTDSEKFLALLLDLRDELGDMEKSIIESLRFISKFRALNTIIGSIEEEKFWALNYFNDIDKQHTEHYTMYYTRSNGSLIISSEPLYGGYWRAISNKPLTPVLMSIPREDPKRFTIKEIKRREIRSIGSF